MLSFSFLSHVSLFVSFLACVFLKVAENRSVGVVFFTRELTSVFHHKTTLKRPVVIYLCIVIDAQQIL